jgi:hypothetical protein
LLAGFPEFGSRGIVVVSEVVHGMVHDNLRDELRDDLCDGLRDNGRDNDISDISLGIADTFVELIRSPASGLITRCAQA